MVTSGNFVRIASPFVGFDLDTLHGYFFRYDFGPNLKFLLEHQKKLALKVLSVINKSRTIQFSMAFRIFAAPMKSHLGFRSNSSYLKDIVSDCQENFRVTRGTHETDIVTELYDDAVYSLKQ